MNKRPSPLSEKLLVREKLDRLLKMEVKNIYFGTLGSGAPDGAFYQPVARFNFLLSGTRPVILPTRGEAVEAILKPGDVQISLPDSWERPRFDFAHEVVCLVPRKTHFRVACHEYLEDGTPGTGDSQYHTPGPATEALRDIYLAICAAATSDRSKGIRHLLSALKEFVWEECQQTPDDSGRRSSEALFKEISGWVETHFQDPINREIVADHFGITPSHVSRLYRKMTGCSFTDLLRQQRIDFALALLSKTNLAVYEIATQCGFSNAAYFVKSFRQLCGEPPSRLRRKLRMEHGSGGTYRSGLDQKTC